MMKKFALTIVCCVLALGLLAPCTVLAKEKKDKKKIEKIENSKKLQERYLMLNLAYRMAKGTTISSKDNKNIKMHFTPFSAQLSISF